MDKAAKRRRKACAVTWRDERPPTENEIDWTAHPVPAHEDRGGPQCLPLLTNEVIE